MLAETQFILNNKEIKTDAPPGLLALDYVRCHERLTGTKEGCKEGDCGACVVLAGELAGEKTTYKPVTSCLMPIGELHGKHLVTIEGLNLSASKTPPPDCMSFPRRRESIGSTRYPDSRLRGNDVAKPPMDDLSVVQQASTRDPDSRLRGNDVGAGIRGNDIAESPKTNIERLSVVQQAIVDSGATQCGFCTPGIVVSLTGLMMDPAKRMDQENIKYALSGHLCRCTGYRSLKSCARQMQAAVSGFAKGNRVRALIEARILPDYFSSIPERLKQIPSPETANGRFYSGRIIAGGTDIYVQDGASLPESSVTLLNRSSSMKEISESDGQIHVGALVTFEEFAEHDLIRQVIPEIKNFMALNASWQIRNRATLGGNIINASPIGDMTALLLALDTDLILQNENGARTVKMREFFKGYKVLDKTPEEILTEIIFPKYGAETKINFEKVSKRKYLDIASVNSAISIEMSNGVIDDAHISMGGVAPIPLYLQGASACLRGQELSVDTVISAVKECQKEISPISDVRGGAEYKRLLARQFIILHFTKLFPEIMSAEAFYETP